MYKTTIRIYGKVQNVGLRVKIKDVADTLGVNGTVENMHDGSVTVVCEAEETTVRKMLDQIRKSSKMATIRDIQTEHSPVTGMEGFQIVYKDTTIELINVVRAGTTTLQGISTKLDNMSDTMTDMSETLGRVENKLDTMDDKLGHMDQKLGHMDQKLGHMDQKLGHMDQKLGHMDQKLGHMDQKLGHMDQKLGHMDQKLGHMDQKLGHMDQKLGHMDQKLGHMDQKLGNIEDTQYQILQTQKDTCSAIESIDSKMNLSLENDKEILKIIKPTR